MRRIPRGDHPESHIQAKQTRRAYAARKNRIVLYHHQPSANERTNERGHDPCPISDVRELFSDASCMTCACACSEPEPLSARPTAIAGTGIGIGSATAALSLALSLRLVLSLTLALALAPLPVRACEDE